MRRSFLFSWNLFHQSRIIAKQKAFLYMYMALLIRPYKVLPPNCRMSYITPNTRRLTACIFHFLFVIFYLFFKKKKKREFYVSLHKIVSNIFKSDQLPFPFFQLSRLAIVYNAVLRLSKIIVISLYFESCFYPRQCVGKTLQRVQWIGLFMFTLPHTNLV